MPRRARYGTMSRAAVSGKSRKTCSRYVLDGTYRGRSRGCSMGICSRIPLGCTEATEQDALLSSAPLFLPRPQQIEDPPQRNAHPVRPVVQLVVELVERLVEHEQPQEGVAVRVEGG